MCTNLFVKAKDGSVVVARSMDFASPTGIYTAEWTVGHKINDQYKVNIPFIGKYTDLHEASDGLIKGRCVSDGVNQSGLSIGSLWLPSTNFIAHYPVKSGELSGFVLLQILLGNCHTTAEAVDWLQKYPVVIPSNKIQRFATVHFSIVDKTGDSQVVEIGTDGTAGSVKVYPNPYGVMTNAPEFPWHVTNLRNFVQTKNWNAEEMDFLTVPVGNEKGNPYKAKKLPRTGFGINQMGLAGDASPPSRFARAAILLNAAIANDGQPENAEAAKRLLDKVMGQVIVIKGSSGDKGNKLAVPPTSDKWDWTQWVFMKNLSVYRDVMLKTDKDLGFNAIDPKPLDGSDSDE